MLRNFGLRVKRPLCSPSGYATAWKGFNPPPRMSNYFLRGLQGEASFRLIQIVKALTRIE